MTTFPKKLTLAGKTPQPGNAFHAPPGDPPGAPRVWVRMIRTTLLLAAPLALIAACQDETPADAPAPSRTPRTPAPSEPASPPPHIPPPEATRPAEPGPLAAALVRAEWRKADNRESCAPLAFTTDAGAPAKPRRANFAGGWAVAFDTPDTRSAYGIAGPGLIPADAAPPAEQAERLGAQWPHFATLAGLPAPAFAGYGVEGAEGYPADNPEGRGLNSLAYLRVGGQACTYNVWSRLGRAHLEALLESLRPL
jgi:hypothetical protein